MAKKNGHSFVSTKQFPENFLLGTATSAFQVEGAWNEDKASTIWDDYFHDNKINKTYRYILDMTKSMAEQFRQKGVEPRFVDMYKGMSVWEVPSSSIPDGERFDFNGDVAADSYHKTDIDIELLKELGVKVYRFSIVSGRIIPNAHDHLPGVNGIKYYNNLIDKLIENGITPMVSLYQYDVPSIYNVIGGLTNSITSQFYRNYARICFKEFGDRVKYWTLCADLWLAADGYSSEHFAPGYPNVVFSGFCDYSVVHQVLVGIAHIYKIYNEEFREKQQGQIGFTVDGTWFYPQDANNPEHQKCADNALMSSFGVFLHILSTGKYPPEFLEGIERSNKREGINLVRAFQFTAEEQELLKNAYDFIILNYYSCLKVRPMTQEEIIDEPNLRRRDRGYFMDVDNITPAEVYDGFLNCIKWTDKIMNHPKIFIGENGYPEDEGVDDSEGKIAYHTGILNKLLEALDDNINVIGYNVWSFLDGIEFTFGYWRKFGIYAVDFNDDSRPRTQKRSFPFFQQLFKTKKLPINN